MRLNAAHPGPRKCCRTPPQALLRHSSFLRQGSQCRFRSPRARKLVEDSGCVCLFYYHRLIIAREVRGLTSISSNCCESLWASAEAGAWLKTFPVQGLGPGAQGGVPNSFKVSPPRPTPIFMPFLSPFSDGP